MNPSTQLTIRFPVDMLARIDAYVRKLKRTVDPAATRATAIRILTYGGLTAVQLDDAVASKKRRTKKKKAK